MAGPGGAGQAGGSLLVAGCARNCARHLPAVLANVERLSSLFDRAAFIVVENDSADDTVSVLDRWGSGRPHYRRLELRGAATTSARTLRLEAARNACLGQIRADPELSAFDWLAILDFDEPNLPPVDTGALRRAIAFLDGSPDRVAAFPNQRGIYYDVWALRHSRLCPDDAWEAVFDHWTRHGGSDDEAFEAIFRTRIHRFDPAGEPVEVDSAFGGLGLYRLSAVLANPHPYVGTKAKILDDDGRCTARLWQTCEHVHFHAGLRRNGGRLFVLPDLINCDTHGFRFARASFRTMLL